MPDVKMLKSKAGIIGLGGWCRGLPNTAVFLNAQVVELPSKDLSRTISAALSVGQSSFF